MSDANEYTTVIQKLLDRTRDGKVAWEMASVGFQAAVKPYLFRISRTEDQGDVTVSLSMDDNQGNEIFEMRATDDAVTLSRNKPLVSTLKEMYDLARRKALNVEAKLDEVKGLLDGM